MKPTASKSEIEYLLKKIQIEYKNQTNKELKKNTNPEHYAELAETLTTISQGLAKNEKDKQHQFYEPGHFTQLAITKYQLRQAFTTLNIPKSHIIDAFYIYLYHVGQQGFRQNPSADPALTRILNKTDRRSAGLSTKKLLYALLFLIILLVAIGLMWYKSNRDIAILKEDMAILPYHPSKQEIDSLEGIWLCYTGSPQARSSDPNRYHQVVFNVVDIKYKNGYFVFNRYGASFDHVGYMQFESPWLVSVYSRVKNGTDSVESPRHSLMLLNSGKRLIDVISASWNFDVGNRDQIIGIREVYIKQGKGGSLKKITETLDNVGCNNCKIVEWDRGKVGKSSFYIKNQLLDTLPDTALRSLLDEKSIILAVPQTGLIKSAPQLPITN